MREQLHIQVTSVEHSTSGHQNTGDKGAAEGNWRGWAAHS